MAPARNTAAAAQPQQETPTTLSQEFRDMIAAIMQQQHQELEERIMRQLEHQTEQQNQNTCDLADRLELLEQEHSRISSTASEEDQDETLTNSDSETLNPPTNPPANPPTHTPLNNPPLPPANATIINSEPD